MTSSDKIAPIIPCGLSWFAADASAVGIGLAASLDTGEMEDADADAETDTDAALSAGVFLSNSLVSLPLRSWFSGVILIRLTNSGWSRRK